ncbi:hypothetical protein C5167_036095, partial [Papaver somniferum]
MELVLKNEDRISILQDDLLLKILDLVDMKTVVKTSVLSTRWSTSDEIAKHLTNWIIVALSRHVQELHIEISSRLTFKLPHQLFISQTLTDLTLDFCEGNLSSDIFLPDPMSLPRLKSLSLNSFNGGSDIKWINKLLSSCPVLNSLEIMDMWVRDDATGVNVDCPELKHLEIINTTESVSFMAMVIKLSTPNLTSFICQDYMLQKYSLENLSSLVTANIHMMREGDEEEDEDKDGLFPKRVMKFLVGLHNVKELTLSPADILQVVSRVPDLMECQSPLFHNLRHLELEMYFTRRCLRTVTWLLRTSPAVETLFITSEESNEEEDDEASSLVPCHFPHLRVMKIRKFRGSDKEIELL